MLNIKKYKGGLYKLQSEQKVDAEIEEVWDFFSKPKNLNRLTPSNLKFKITSDRLDEFYEGKIFTYRIQLFPLISFNWTTEITKIKKGNYFIDKQLFGPYKLWHHEHHFKENKDGTITIIDKVHYKLHFYPISKFIHKIFIKQNLIKIFRYRSKNIKHLF